MKNPIQFVDLKKQYRTIKAEIDKVIKKVLNEAQFINGPEVEEFEKNFAKFCKTKFCTSVGSGHCALELIFEALGVGKEDEVIVPVNSYISTALAPSFTGAKIVFVDCKSDTFNIDPELIEKAITPKTKIITVTHLYGQPAEMDKIMTIAKKYNLKIVEDAAQAHGSSFNKINVGNFGIACAYSFYPGKNLGCYGDGGAVTTNNEELYKKIKLLKYFGQTRKYVHDIKGHNTKLDTIQAAILNVKLKHLNDWTKKRIANAKYYTKKLKGLPITTPFIQENSKHVFHVYCIVTEKRDELFNYLKENKINANIHYPIPIHLQNAYKDLGYKLGDFPISESLSKKILSLPMYPELTFKEIDYIVETIKKFYKLV